MMAALVELGRDIVLERTTAASRRPRLRAGRRQASVDTDMLAAAKARRAGGESPTQIAKALGVSRASVCRRLADV